MAQVLFTWELGGGIGHLMTLRPLAERFVKAGHEVTLALREVSRAETLYEGIDVRIVQAPVKVGRTPNRFANPATFAHILFNTGFAQVPVLSALVQSWRILLDYVQPDLIVFDHSPTALLASRGGGAKRVIVGNGFYCPAALDQMPDWRPWDKNDPEKLRRDEQHVLDNANQVLLSDGQAPLGRLSDLFSQVDETLLTTFREFDAMAERGNGEYWGVWRTPFGKPPSWPAGDGPRVFLYLKPCKALPTVLTELARRGLPTIAYAGSLDRRTIDQLRSPNVILETDPVDMDSVARECDLAILNATHGSVLQILLAGKPLLMFPLFLEHRITGQQCVDLGAGLMLDALDTSNVPHALDLLLTDNRFEQAAQQFASRYAHFDAQQSLNRAMERLMALATGGPLMSGSP